MSIRPDYINFGNTASIEKYLELRCGKPLQYLKEKGVLSLVAKDFANQSIFTQFGDMPFNNKLVLILTSSSSKLNMDPDIMTRTIMPILTTYLKEYVPEEEIERPQNENNKIPGQNGNRNHLKYLTLAVIGVAISVFAAYRCIR